MFKWFRKETDVKALEKELALLASKVNKHEAFLSQLRSNSRRFKGAVTLYSVLFYAIYFAIWLAFLARHPHDRMKFLYETIPIIGGPILIYFLRSIVSAYYERRIANEETQLDALKTQQKDKIEEFKTKTDFYTTKSLIDRYSASDSSATNSPESRKKTPAGTPVSGVNAQAKSQTQQSQKQFNNSPRLQTQSQLTPQRPPQSLMGTVPTPATLSGTPQYRVPEGPPKIAEFAPNAEAQQDAGERHWYDRMLDVIVGEDEGSDKSRYRLEKTIREREEKITNLELELIKLRKIVDSSETQSAKTETDKEALAEETILQTKEGSSNLPEKTTKTRRSKRQSKDNEDEGGE